MYNQGLKTGFQTSPFSLIPVHLSLSNYLEITGGVEQKVGGLQVTVQDVGRVDVLQPSQDLVEEVADVVVAQVLSLKEFVQVGLHEILDNVSAQFQVKELLILHLGNLFYNFHIVMQNNISRFQRWAIN